MKVLVLGGTGFVGRTIVKHLDEVSDVETIVAARNQASAENSRFLAIDATDTDSLSAAFAETDVVVNCVTGSGSAIRDSAAAIVAAARGRKNGVQIVHMSSMAVYGNRQGVLDESTDLSEEFGWYGKAKVEAENIFQKFAETGGSSTILRIGCVYGARSSLWVDRIGLLLKSGRLGNLGEMADGCSNLVHVNDIAKAVELSLDLAKPGSNIYNLSAPDSPRWNKYFEDFSLAIGRIPIKYKTRLSMLIESKIIAPPLKAAERLSDRGWIKNLDMQCIPPSLLRLWQQQIKLDSSKIEDELAISWTTYDEGLKDSIDYFRNRYDN